MVAACEPVQAWWCCFGGKVGGELTLTFADLSSVLELCKSLAW